MSALHAGRRRRDGSQDNHERWLVSYADFLTLLFGFFVVMYAISSVNDGKYKILSEVLLETFAAEQSAIEPIQTGEPARHSAPSVIDFRQQATSVDTEQGDSQLDVDVQAIRERFAGLTDDATLSVQADNDWLQINMDARMLFGIGEAELSREAQPVLAEVSAFLAEVDNVVSVEGYTDNTATNSRRFPSNWELSSARAASVVRALIERGIAPERLSAIGHGENYPLQTNATREGRAANRRVSIVVARRFDPGADGGFIVRQVVNPEPVIVTERLESGGLRFSTQEP